jgi:aminobenzoyl-glutamate utilization protein B
MVVAAKTIALTGVDLFTNPEELKAARASFEQRRAGYEYRSRIPADHKPPLNYRDKQ